MPTADNGSPATRLVSLKTTKPADIRRAVDAIQTSNSNAQARACT